MVHSAATAPAPAGTRGDLTPARARRFLGATAFLSRVGLAATAACVGAGPEDRSFKSARLQVVRQVSWPGAGHELTVRIADGRGRPVRGDLSAHISVLSGGEALPSHASPIALDPGFTAIVLPALPGGERRADIAGVVQEFIAGRPRQERIALYRWGRDLRQYATFSRDRARLRRLLVRYARDDAPGGEPLAPGTAGQAAAAVAAIGGSAPAVLRALVLIGPGAEAQPESSEPRVASFHLDAERTDLGVALREVGARLDALAERGHYRVGVCPRHEATAVQLRVRSLVGVTTTGTLLSADAVLPAPLPEQRRQDCHPPAIDSREREFPDLLELVLDDAARDTYEERLERVASAPEEAKADLEVAVRLARGEEPIPATMHLRGQSSLECQRRSFTVKLSGPARPLFPGVASREFYLLAMCDDPHYVHQYTALQLLAGLDLYPLAFRYVRLVLGGAPQGVYLMVDKAREAFQRQNARVRIVMRRDYGEEQAADDRFEIKYAADADEASASWSQVASAIADADGDALVAALQTHLDLDKYLRWIAFNSATLNGDYLDEVWFVGTEGAGADGSAQTWFDIAAWDLEDTFSGCHFAGEMAWEDPHRLVYCAESALDHRIFADPAVYDRYVDRLEELLARELDEPHFAAAAQTTRRDLLARLADDAAAEAMEELTGPEGMRADEVRDVIGQAIDELQSRFTARRQELLERIEAYRSASSSRRR
jgi:hypothetical protein